MTKRKTITAGKRKTLDRKAARRFKAINARKYLTPKTESETHEMIIQTCEECNCYDDVTRPDSFMIEFPGDLWLCGICAEARELPHP